MEMTLVPFKHARVPAARSGNFDDFDRIFDNFFRNAMTNMAAPASGAGDMAVRLDISETDKAYIVSADLPGLEEEHIDVSVEDGLLTISGEKQQENEEEGKTFHRIERSYGSFKRTLQLPSDANEDKIKAHMKKGVLELEIPKTKEAQKQAKRIAIKSSS